MPSSLLTSTTASGSRTRPSLLLLQSSVAQTCLPVLHNLIDQAARDAKSSALLFCFLYSPSTLYTSDEKSTRLQIQDLTDNVPGYSEHYREPEEVLLDSVKSGMLSSKREQLHLYIERCVIPTAPDGPLDMIIDSVETLHADLQSVSKTYRVLSDLFVALHARNGQQYRCSSGALC